MDIFTPPEVDTKEIGCNPENPLLTVETCHQELTDTIGRIGNTITERATTMDTLLSQAHTNPDNGSQGQVLEPVKHR